MPRSKTYLTPAEYAVLGLVRLGPTYGYELQPQLTSATGLGRVCRIEPAMIYAVLKSLSGLELIDGVWDDSAYPPKAVYTATEAGEVEFERWLRRPVSRLREVRLDFLIKLYFALQEEGPQAGELVTAQIAVCEEYERRLTAELNTVPTSSFDQIVLESKLSAARLTIEWLVRCMRQIAVPDGEA